MKVCVTGGAGYVGSVTVDALLKAGYEVVVIDDLSMGHSRAVNRNALFYTENINDEDEVNLIFEDDKFDAVIHLAALTAVEKSMKEPELYYYTNIGGSLNILNAMVRNGVRKIIFASSATVYGHPTSPVPLLETDNLNPINPYGETKYMFERILKWYGAAHGIKHISFRYFNVAGASENKGQDHEPETSLIPNVLRAALHHNPMNIYGDDYNTIDGTCVRDYVHVEDIAQAHLLALQKMDEVESGAFNLSGVSGFSVKEVVSSVRKVTGSVFSTNWCGRRAGDTDKLVANSDKARNILGWKPKYISMDDIVGTAWDWQQKHPRGYADRKCR